MTKLNLTALFQQTQTPELPWLPPLRQEAFASFMQGGFPSRHEENWKYTDLTAIANYPLQLATSAPAVAYQTHFALPCQRLVFVDGYWQPVLSTIDDLEPGLKLLTLREALLEESALLGTIFSEASQTTNRLVHLNTAFFSEGVFIQVAKNSKITKPIHLVYITTQSEVIYQPRQIICLEANSQAMILEEHLALTEMRYYKNIVTQTHLAPGAKLQHYKIQHESAAAVHTAATDIKQDRDSQIISYSLSFGAKLARDDLEVMQQEVGADCQLRGLYLLADQQHIDHHTRIDHTSQHGTSDEYYKGILTDKATGVFNGKVIVHKDAQQTKSQQSNKNILLTKTAQMNTKPELEIYADDVQCAHGATVGQIDDEGLFYLRSRGLDESNAKALLTQAFISDLLSQVSPLEIATYLRRLVMNKIDLMI